MTLLRGQPTLVVASGSNSSSLMLMKRRKKLKLSPKSLRPLWTTKSNALLGSSLVDQSRSSVNPAKRDRVPKTLSVGLFFASPLQYFRFNISHCSLHQPRLHHFVIPSTAIPDCFHKVSLCIWLWFVFQRFRRRIHGWSRPARACDHSFIYCPYRELG